MKLIDRKTYAVSTAIISEEQAEKCHKNGCRFAIGPDTPPFLKSRAICAPKLIAQDAVMEKFLTRPIVTADMSGLNPLDIRKVEEIALRPYIDLIPKGRCPKQFGNPTPQN